MPYIDPHGPMVNTYDARASIKRVRERLELSKEAREELRKEKYALSQQPGCHNGIIVSPAAWEKVPQHIRHNTLMAMFLDLGDGISPYTTLNKMALPTVKAAITADPDILVEVLDSNLREMEVEEAFAKMLLGSRTHPLNSGDIGKIPVPQADEYIFKIKKAGMPYHTVVSNKVVTQYEVTERGVRVTIDKFSADLLAWNELQSQMLYMSRGSARSINMMIYDRLLSESAGDPGALSSPETDLQNVGGVGASTILEIDGTNATRYSTTGSTGLFIYEDFLNASKHIQSRPNPAQMQFMVMKAHQWLQAQQWSVAQQIAFQRVLGRDMDLSPSPNFNGVVVGVTVIVDDDLPTYVNGTALNCIVFVGPARNVGDFIDHRAMSMQQTIDISTNEDIVVAAHSNAAKWWGYNNIAVGTGYAVA